MRITNKCLLDIRGTELTNAQKLTLRGGTETLWIGDCAVHHPEKPDGPFWKLVLWSWEGTGEEAEAACTNHYSTNEEQGAWCFCDYLP